MLVWGGLISLKLLVTAKQLIIFERLTPSELGRRQYKLHDI